MWALLVIMVSAAPAPAAGAPDAGAEAKPPTAREMAQLFFLAGDLKRAIDAAIRCIQTDGRKKCEPFYRALVEYEALIHKNDQLTLPEAKSYLEWDRTISPDKPGKLTEPVIERYVKGPLEAARAAWQRGEREAALAAVERVQKVDPKNADAKQLKAELTR
ncbi:MAG: hypothetical protein JNK82_30335 [Myxococcaceae bacterium]|nr:hypothetical protein [Myxococcaceae bacterium]